MYNLLHDKEIDNNIDSSDGLINITTLSDYFQDVFYFYLKDTLNIKEIEAMVMNIVDDIVLAQK